MTAEAMPPARRRPIPGMTVTPPTPAPPAPSSSATAISQPSSLPTVAPTAGAGSRRRHREPDQRAATAIERSCEADSSHSSAARARRPALDYGTTRLVNFRIPVDLHDRYRQLVRDAERKHPRLRHPSLTELVIALLEEGPATPKDVASMIRRKRAAEHGLES